MTDHRTHGDPGAHGHAGTRGTVRLARFLFTLLVLVAASMAPAAPVAGEEFELAQPDRSLVRVRIWGDEYHQVVESLDGYTLVRDPDTLVICYAEVSGDGNRLVSTGVRHGQPRPARLAPHLRVRPEAARDQAAKQRARFEAGMAETDAILRATLPLPDAGPPDKGNVRGITIIVDFADQAGTIPPSEVDAFCNLIGYNNNSNAGSIRDYFRDVSGGALDYTNHVPALYYRAKQPKTYYDNPAEDAGPKARELVLEALQWLDTTQGLDFSQFDSNGDGRVDAVNVFYAGSCSSGWSKGLWPHQWSVSFSADGVSTRYYQITDMRSALQIRTFLHENGHMICGWPDLYDYGSESYGIGNYCLMGYGGGSNTNPVPPSPAMKILSGWAEVRPLTTAAASLQAPWAGHVVYRYNNPHAANEYYLVNNLQKTGRGTRYPDAGLAVWHIDDFGSNNNEAMTSTSHYRVTLVQADNRWDLERKRNYGDSTDLYDAASYNRCDGSTAPNTDWWSGWPSGLKISNISASGAVMTFDFGDPDTMPPTAVCRVDDSTLAGRTTIPVRFAATDTGGAGVANVALWVRPPGTPALADSGMSAATASGTFTYTATHGDGAYRFAVRATDHAGNAAPAPTAPDVTVWLNVEARSSFARTVDAADDVLVFPMTDDLDLTVTLAGATPGGTVTLTGHGARGDAPAGINYPGRLVDDRAEITATLPAGFTARIEWPVAAGDAAALAPLAVDTAFRAVAGTVVQEIPVTLHNGVATVEGVTAFSTWYLGNSTAVPVTLSGFAIE